MNNEILNEKYYRMTADYLTEDPAFVTKDVMKEYMKFCPSETYAFALALAVGFNLDVEENGAHKQFFHDYILPSVHKIEQKAYAEDPYFKAVGIKSAKENEWELKKGVYLPYEGFIANETIITERGIKLPYIGFFDERYEYPSVLQNGRVWMTITPNEVETQRYAISRAYGKVLTYGLGLGYYAFSVAAKKEVSSVTVVELDKTVIDLFKKYILPEIPFGNKIKIVCEDAFVYAEKYVKSEKYDYIFADIWHDAEDGKELYLKMKELEKYSPSSEYGYWIENEIKLYL